MAPEASALRLPSDSEGEASALAVAGEERRVRAGLLPRRAGLLGLGALALAACGLAALARRSPQQPPPRLRGAGAADFAEEDDDLACLLFSSGPGDEEDSAPASLLEEGGLLEEDMESLLEEGADERDDESMDELTEHLARSLQQKVAVPLVPAKAVGPHPKKKQKPLWKVYTEADMDHDRVLEGPEIQNLGRALTARFHLAPGMYDRLYEQAGKCENGQMKFKDVVHFSAVLFIFSQADQDHNDILSGEELSVEGFALAHRLGRLHLRPEVFERLQEKADANGDQQFDPAEMRQLFTEARAYFLPPPLFKLFRSLDKDMSDSLEGAELEGLPVVLKNRFRLPPSYLEGILSKDKLDRRDFKELFWKAWDGSPFRHVGPWQMIAFFHRSDKDGSSYVEGQELIWLTHELHNFFWVNVSKIAELVKAVDSSADHRVSPHDFVDLIEKTMELSPFAHMCPQMIHIFKMTDHNKDRLIDGPELKILAGHMQRRFKATKEEVAQAAASVDADGDGKLAPQEFHQLLAALRDRNAAVAGGVLLRSASQEVESAGRSVQVKY